MNNFQFAVAEKMSMPPQNRYRQRIPTNLTLPGNLQQLSRDAPTPSDYWSPGQDAANILSKMNYRVNDDGFYIPSPAVLTPQVQQRQVFTFEFSTPTNTYHMPPTYSYMAAPPVNYSATRQCRYQAMPGSYAAATPSCYPATTDNMESSANHEPWKQIKTIQHQSQNNFSSAENCHIQQQRLMTSDISSESLKNNMANMKSEKRLQSCAYAPEQSSCNPVFQLQIPGIHPSSSVAMNIMKEETDLGYCSFSDLSPLASATTSPTGERSTGGGVLQDRHDVSDMTIGPLDSNFNDDCLTQLLCDVMSYEGELRDLKDLSTDIDVKTEEAPRFSCAFMDSNIHEENVSYMDQSAYITPDVAKSKPGISVPVVVKKVHKCIQCDKVFASNTNLVVHMRQHSGERPHKCSHCGKSFAQRSTLRTHLRVHTGEKPYGCKDCGRSFADYSTFAKHRRVHTGEKPYVCDKCGKGFAQSGNMIRHKLTHQN